MSFIVDELVIHELFLVFTYAVEWIIMNNQLQATTSNHKLSSCVIS